MRWIPVLLALAAGGCANLPLEPVSPPAPPPAAAPRTHQPLDADLGWVQSINDRLRFVVLDYSLNRLPAVGDRLDVIREDAVVGELKVTGPSRGGTTVADIVDGDPRAGDQVRPRRSPNGNP
ncbi:MAG: hypothetical protein KIT22_14170 [Verrucomicrobiae bacterium]|nr:hypothetical protein [Verrucomicrobiae bacterium]